MNLDLKATICPKCQSVIEPDAPGGLCPKCLMEFVAMSTGGAQFSGPDREGRLLARLNHPNIVAIYDFGQQDGFYYLLMEYVDRVNLRQAYASARFTQAQALSVIPKICEALQFAHDDGVMHRDIKPEKN